ncbi:hypothetical protein DYB32_001283, partial [Aphanomyces invadans]
MELRLNKQIMYIVALMVILCVTGASLGTKWNLTNLSLKPHEKAWYLYRSPRDRMLTSPTENFVMLCLYYFLLLNSFIPVSLYVSMTSVKFIQAYFMNADVKMYHAESNTPCQVRTMSLNEELGQINYVFSDKTGTLTCNVMEFRKCSIQGVAYGLGDTEVGVAAKLRQNIHHQATHLSQTRPVVAPFVNFQDDSIFESTSPSLPLFWEHLAVCHTVMPECASDGSLRLSASSPDEQALVAAAASFGYSFYARTPGEALVKTPFANASYKILDVLEFNSTRKRMSVVVEKPDGALALLCKGADTVIYERLAVPSNNMAEIEKRRNGEPNQIDTLMEALETNLEVLGATAIEDKLQAGVPDAIAKLRDASIKVWMLTGDKEETAINIGFACQLLHLDMDLIVISGNNHSDIDEIVASLEKYQDIPTMELHDKPPRDKALVVDGETLELALLHCPSLLLNVAEQCAAVIACRVSPAQKAEMVTLVKDNVKGSITLAIGDGANDVSMIQAAHVGIGISGQEGMQAANSSDYSIAQFRYLIRLLFVHGRWNYVRMSTLILYTFYKNVMMNMTQYAFMAFSAFSGQKFFLEWGLQGFNLIFTALPIVLVGALDQDVPDYLCEAFPKLYSVGQLNRKFNGIVVARWIMSCVWESGVICLFTIYGLKLDNTSVPMWTFGSCAFTCVIFVVNLKLMLNQHLHTAWHIVVYVVSIGLWWVMAHVVSSSTFSFFWRNAFSLIKGHGFWTLLPLVLVTALARDVYWKGFLRNFYPSYTNLAQEVHCFKWQDRASYLLQYPPPEDFATDVESPQVVAGPKAASFSHQHSGPFSPRDTSLHHRMSVRGVAFSYDAETVMAQSFLATQHPEVPPGPGVQVSLKRHASIGSLAFQQDHHPGVPLQPSHASAGASSRHTSSVSIRNLLSQWGTGSVGAGQGNRPSVRNNRLRRAASMGEGCSEEVHPVIGDERQSDLTHFVRRRLNSVERRPSTH